MSYRYLSSTTIGEIHDAAIATGLSRSRTALFSAIDPGFVDAIPTDASPANQLRLDLGALNAAESLEDNTVPLEGWLSTAAQLVGPRRQVVVFRGALAQVKEVISGARAPAMGARRVGPGADEVSVVHVDWDGTLSGAEQEALMRALVAAFPSLAALRAMVRFKLDTNLAEIAADGGLTAVVFEVIEQARARGWTKRLLVGALEDNPGSPELLAFASAHGVTPKV
jgi:hypothetical protein